MKNLIILMSLFGLLGCTDDLVKKDFKAGDCILQKMTTVCEKWQTSCNRTEYIILEVGQDNYRTVFYQSKDPDNYMELTEGKSLLNLAAVKVEDCAERLKAVYNGFIIDRSLEGVYREKGNK